MANYILDKLNEITDQDSYPLHMPGHKRNDSFFPFNFVNVDITEINGADNLHNPKGIIKQAQEEMANLLGASESYFLVNGGSSGMLAAILSCCNPNDNVLVAANCHKSVYDGLILAGVNPIYISPQITEEGLCAGLNIRDIFRAFDTYDIKAMIVTSPSYEGFTLDISTIADIVHKNNSILIVDECHGAHFVFSDKFPTPALNLGADLVVNSWHKTLPCLNQSAVISKKGDKIDTNRLKMAISMTNTTSPSYPIMASIDNARDILTKDKNLFTQYLDTIRVARQELSHCKTFKLIDDSIKGQNEIFDIDISKFTIMIRTDMTGTELEQILAQKYNIQIEMAGLHHIIAITSVADDPKGIKKFVKAITDLDKKYERKYIEKISLTPGDVQTPKLKPREVFFADKISVNLHLAVGKIIASSIIAYPPGIPIVAIGQELTKEHIEVIEKLINDGVTIMGIENNEVLIVQE